MVDLTVRLEIKAADHDDAETIIDQIKTKVTQAGWVCTQSYQTSERIEQ